MKKMKRIKIYTIELEDCPLSSGDIERMDDKAFKLYALRQARQYSDSLYSVNEFQQLCNTEKLSTSDLFIRFIKD